MLLIQQPRFSSSSTPSAPLSMRLQGNQLMSRMVIEALGVDAWWIGLARNKYERIEKGIDLGFRWSMGFIMPIFIDKLFNRWYAKRAMKKPATVMRVPFMWLEQAGFAKRLQDFAKDPAKQKQLQDWGIRGVAELKTLAPKIMKGKLWVVFLDVLIMASQSHFKAWYKNDLTEKLSKRKGFSGIFNEVSKKSQDADAKAFEASKGWRKAVSFSVGTLSVLALPLIFRATLKSKSPVGVGLWGKLKPWLEKFEYKNAVYVSKYLIAYQSLINYNIPQLLACRDKHERRETIVKIGLLEFFWFCGDVVLSGLGALALTRLLGNKLKTPLVAWTGKTGFKLPVAKPLDKLFEQVGKSVTYRWAAANYWMGILLTSLIIGISTPLLNNWYTRQKIRRQQAQKAPVIPSAAEGSPERVASRCSGSTTVNAQGPSHRIFDSGDPSAALGMTPARGFIQSSPIQPSFSLPQAGAYNMMGVFPVAPQNTAFLPQNPLQIQQKNITISHRAFG